MAIKISYDLPKTNMRFNPLSANPSKWLNTKTCLSVFDHLWDWCLKG